MEKEQEIKNAKVKNPFAKWQNRRTNSRRISGEIQSMKLTTEKTIAIAHHLMNYDGACAHVHGHNVRVQVELNGKPNRNGFLADFKDIKGIINELDHKDINAYISQPTAENICLYYLSKFESQLKSNIESVTVRVWESTTSSVEETITLS